MKQRLWDYPNVRGEAVEQGINAYLVDVPSLLVRTRRKPLSPELPTAHFGTMPLGVSLIVEVDEYNEVAADPIAVKYLRPFRTGNELVQGLDRWCLWLGDVDFNPNDISRSPVLSERIAANKQYRSNAPKKGDAYKYRDTPHLMRPNPHRPLVPYVGISRVVSETRKFYTVDHLTPDVIAADSVYTVLDPDGLLFALVLSSMFITWQRTVGGALESRLRFSNTLTWNTFPVPMLDEQTRQRVIDAGKKC